MGSLWCAAGFRLEILSAISLLSAVPVFSKVGDGPLQVRTSWSRTPTDGVQPTRPFNLPAAATSAAASRTRGNRYAAGADGSDYVYFDTSFHPSAGVICPTFNKR